MTVPAPGFQDDFVQLLSDLDALEGWKRPQQMVAFARSPLFSGAGMIPTPWMPEEQQPFHCLRVRVHREAYQALKHDTEASSTQRDWYFADMKIGRSSIKRLLNVEGAEGSYATWPFRTVTGEDGTPYIGAAVSPPKMMSSARPLFGEHLDIGEILHWNPRVNSVTLAGDPHRHGLLMPSEDNRSDSLTVYGDACAFFQAWAAKRRTFLMSRQLGGEANEPSDGGLPGALLIGEIDRAAWHTVAADVLVAGPGIDRSALYKAVRAACMPRVTELA